MNIRRIKYMNITAKDVQTLRERTGCGMMDCKNALVETEGDMEKAVALLREKGLAAAAKKSSRIAAEGTVCAVVGGGDGILVEVNAETDFVTKSEQFQSLAASIANLVFEKQPKDVDELLDMDMGGLTVGDAIRDKILTIGENISVRRFVRLSGNVVSYIHGGGRIGVLVSFDADACVVQKDAFAEFAKDVAMQIAALSPLYVASEDVPEDVIASEKEILIAQIRNDEKNAGKPESIIEKMVDGRIGKYYETNCLLNQAFVKDGAVTVEKHAQNVSKELGGDIKIKCFVRYEKGEGIQKREDNLADEVAKMIQ